MKIGGKRIEGLNEGILVLPRGDDDPIVFRARAIVDMAEFTAMCPDPEAPKILKRGGEVGHDFNDKSYLAAMSDYAKLRSAWMLIVSLEATPGLEWDTVDKQDPTTWGNYEQDLKNAGFGDLERARILALVMEVNAVSETKLQEARDRFLLGPAVASQNESSPSIAKKNTPSGELVSDSA
jgi:hypothetical protein